MSELKEYIISLHNFDDLEEFYQDMETLRPTQYGVMPERAVDCHVRRPISRNTHYLLTDEEAETLRADPRILAVEVHPKYLGIELRPSFVQTSANWNKSSVGTVNAHRNWGLYRVMQSSQISNWGSDGNPDQAGTVTTTSEGLNVDVVICDGHFDPSHPEFAKNSDGTGGSRVVQYDWLQDSLAVTGNLPSGTYSYTPYVGTTAETANNNHGCHVAGTACGNSQGWARKANIYNINPYSTNPNYASVSDAVGNTFVFDFIRFWHNKKQINPATGRTNPTIVNSSWGNHSSSYLCSQITSIYYQGVVYNGPFTASNLATYGIYAVADPVNGDYFYFSMRNTSLDVDVADCISAGIIMIGAAGNMYARGTNDPNDVNYNNFFKLLIGSTTYTIFYSRGESPGVACITVGSVSSLYVEMKSSFSNCGPVVDIFAPGSYILSSLNTGGTTYDYRNASYSIAKYSGTSMASPQVTGVVACALETYPNAKQADVISYLGYYGGSNKLTSLAAGSTGDLQGATNLYLKYVVERPVSGDVYPKVNMSVRPTSGQVFPRPRILRYGI